MMELKIDRTVLHLQTARTLRSISQGIAVVDLTLYLKDLRWSAAAIGGVLSAAGLVGAVLILFVGILSDKLGRKPFLMVYETMTALAALLMTFTANPVILTAVIVITGFGRGQNGAAGPFTPAEQAWLAAHVPRSSRGRVFSTNNALGFFGMALGAVLGGATRFWMKVFPDALSFHPLFFLMFLFSIICAIVIVTAPTERKYETEGEQSTIGQDNVRSDTPAENKERTIRRQENRNIAKLAAVNMLNGLAIGFMGPMMSYWFSIKFGVSSSEIGITLALSFVVTGASSLITGTLSQRFGMVKSVVWLRFFGGLMVLVMPLFPQFWFVSAIYILRSALSRGTQGARAALSSSLTRDERRGFSVSMNSLVMRLTSAVGPTLSGYMLDMGAFAIPVYVAGGLQLISTVLYGKLFHAYDNPDDKAQRNAM